MEKIGTSLLYEDAKIRIWNLLLEPGQTAAMHQHEFPYVYVVVTPGETLMTESDGNEVRQADNQWQVVRHDTGLPHSLQNLGTRRYENIIVELKHDCTGVPGSLPAVVNPDERVISWLEGFAPPQAVCALRSHLTENPGRISRGYNELLEGYTVEAGSLLKVTREVADGELRPGWVTVDEIDFVSMCPHHFLPYLGVATVAYRPTKKILGLGKIPRYVEALARRFVIQEDLTRDIALGISAGAGTPDVKVTTAATHTCICRRGVRQTRTRTTVEFILGE